jgi:hypothetical protein
MAAADNNRRATIRGRNGRTNESFPFAVREAVGLAQNAQDREAVHPEVQHELDESLPRFEVNAFVVMEGRGEDRDDPTEHGALLAPKLDSSSGLQGPGG